MLWKLFLDRYDNPVTKAGAVRLVRSFYEKANTKDILGLFALYTEHYSKLGAVAKVIQQPQSAGRSLSLLLTPKRRPQTPATADGTQTSMGAGILADIASMPWAWTLHSLFRIINELPNEAELINKFIYHEIEKDANQELTDLTK